jgi:hypothetical protein
MHAHGCGVLVELDDVALDPVQVAGRAWRLIRTRSPTLSIANALAELTVRNSSCRARIASAIAVRCGSSSPAAIWSSSRRSGSIGVSGCGVTAGEALICGWVWGRGGRRERLLMLEIIQGGADGPAPAP